MLTRIRLDQMEANPYRHFETYPIVQEKIDALIESIGATGFWGETVIARSITKTSFQIAFGHHRIEAARKALGKRAKVEISVRELGDSQMLAMMARENNETYAITADMDMEIVRAAIEGFAEGYIDLPAPKLTNRGAQNGLSPDEFGLMCTDPSHIKFTREGLSDLLGIPHRRIVAALRNLKLVNTQGVATSKDYQGLKHDQAAELSRAVAKVETKAGKKAAKKAAGRISKSLKEKRKAEDDTGRRPSRVIAQRIADEEIEKVIGREVPDINDVSETIGRAITNFLTESALSKTLSEIVKYKDSLGALQQRSLISKLSKLEQTAAKYRDELQSDQIRRVK